MTYEEEYLKDQQQYEYNKMLEKADSVVLTAVATTATTGAVPIPFADAPLLIGEQVAMMLAINNIFKIVHIFSCKTVVLIIIL